MISYNILDEITCQNSPEIHFSFIAATQLEWNASPNKLHLSDLKQSMPISASTVTNTTQITTTTNPLPNDEDTSQVSMSVTTSIIQFPNNVSNSQYDLSSDSDSSRDSKRTSHSDIIDSYLKNLSILPPLLPLVSPLANNDSSSNSNLPTMPQQNLPLLQHSSSSSITNPKQQHQLSKSESAMLNYIYDQYAPNKHKHYDFR